MVPKISTKMPEIPLFPSCLQPCMSIMHVQMCMCMCMCTCVGVTPNPPTPTKNLKAQILLEAKIWHIMSLDAKLQIFSSKFEVVVGGVSGIRPPPTTTPKLQLDFKSKKSSCSLGVVVGGVWHQTPPPPTTTPKLQLDFKSKKSSCSLGVVVGVGGLNITSTNSGTFYI